MLVGAAVIYGAMFSVNKIAASGGAPPLAYAFWQSSRRRIGAVDLLMLRGGRLGVSRQALTSYLVIGALVISVPITLLTYIAPKLPAGIMTLVLALSPPFTFIIGVAARSRAFSLARSARIADSASPASWSSRPRMQAWRTRSGGCGFSWRF